MAYSKCEYNKNTTYCLLYFNKNGSKELLNKYVKLMNSLNI